MDFWSILLKKSKFFYIYLLILGGANGLLNIAVLFTINRVISGNSAPLVFAYSWMDFAAVVVVSFVISKVFQTYVIHVTSEIHFELETGILQKLREMRYDAFEGLGHEKVYAAMSDIRILETIPETVFNGINAVLIITCSIGYLVYIDLAAGLSVLLIMVMLFLFYLIRSRQIERQHHEMRTLQGRHWRMLLELLEGFREVFISQARRKNIYDNLLRKNSLRIRDIRDDAEKKALTNELVGQYFWYIVIGIVLFMMPALMGVGTVAVSSFLITILYITGAISVIVTSLPRYTYAKVALVRLHDFKSHMDEQESMPQREGTSVGGTITLDTIRFQGVTYTYRDDKKEPIFQVGPLDVVIQASSIIFITGTNGSGKSTFLNLLTGLYRQEDGSIYLNDVPVSDESYARYREQIGVVFTNPYLFTYNVNGFDLENNDFLRELIGVMGLTGIVRQQGPDLVFDNKLSRGQQKRLALIYTLLEQKPVVVLDEWAAEQDPAFRKYFYKDLLPALKARGITIIAVTHDDAYFDCADRVIRFEYGKIVQDELVYQS